MYHIVLVEDEQAARDVLAAHVERYAAERGEELDLTWFPTAQEFMACTRTFDLVLLDIQMPGLSGMEAAELLRAYDEATPIIFVTDLAQYAVRGYEVDALDFMVKPVSYSSFSMRMDRAMRVLRQNGAERLVLDVHGGPLIVPARSLVYVELKGHDLVYHLDDGTQAQQRGSMRQAEEELGGGSFLRVSSGVLVNMAHVQAVQGDALLMSDGARLYFSRPRRKEALETLARYLGSRA